MAYYCQKVQYGVGMPDKWALDVEITTFKLNRNVIKRSWYREVKPLTNGMKVVKTIPE